MVEKCYLLQVILLQVPLEVAWTATVSWEAGDLVCRVMVFLRSVQTIQYEVTLPQGRVEKLN